MDDKLRNSPTPKPTDSLGQSLSWYRAWPALLCATLSSLAFIIVEFLNLPNVASTLAIVLGMQLPSVYLRRLKHKRGESSLWLFWSIFSVWLIFIIISLGFSAYRDGLF